MPKFSQRLRSQFAPFDRHINESRPPRWLLGLEWRASLELASLPVALPWLLGQVPRGDGHSVMVLPGLLASDRSTLALRHFLKAKGYAVQGWGLGRNFGPRPAVVERMRDALAREFDRSGRRLSLIGWSLGGIFARELARHNPQAVRQVISLGSPLYGNPAASTHAWLAYRLVSGRHRVGEHDRGDAPPPSVPTTSIYTRSDGVVGWGCCVEHESALSDNIEINGTSHFGLGVNPLVWLALGDRLAQPENNWRHFRPQGVGRLLFPFKASQRPPFTRHTRQGAP